MAQYPRVTHAYSYPEGWVSVPRRTLSPELTADLIDRGFTMARVREGLFGSREVSLRRHSARY